MLSSLLNIKLMLDNINNSTASVELRNAAVLEVKHNYLRSNIHGHSAVMDVLRAYADSLLAVEKKAAVKAKKPAAKKAATK